MQSNRRGSRSHTRRGRIHSLASSARSLTLFSVLAGLNHASEVDGSSSGAIEAVAFGRCLRDEAATKADFFTAAGTAGKSAAWSATRAGLAR